MRRDLGIVSGNEDIRVSQKKREELNEFECRKYTSDYVLEKVNKDLVLAKRGVRDGYLDDCEDKAERLRDKKGEAAATFAVEKTVETTVGEGENAPVITETKLVLNSDEKNA